MALASAEPIRNQKGIGKFGMGLPNASMSQCRKLESEVVSGGVPEPQAKQITTVEYVRSNVKFLFQEAEIPGTAMFDVRLKAGTIIILIDARHPARAHFFDLLKQEGAEVDTPAQKR
jgi:hypothetical protein